MLKVPLFSLLLFLVLHCQAWGQKQITHQSLYWLRYFNTLNLTPRWNLQNELDTRHFFENHRQQQLIIHSRVVYRPSEVWNFGIGLTGSWQKSQDPTTYPRPRTPEYRLVEEAGINKPLLENLTTNFRIRVEQRFISNHTGSFDRDHTFRLRHRYRAQLSYFWTKPNVTFRASEELFVNSSRNDLFDRLDQNRTYVSVEKRVSPALSFEVGYMNINQSFKKSSLYVRRDNLRITLFHTLSPRSTTP